MSEYAEQDIEKVATPPLVHDATQPTDPAGSDDDAGPKTGALVAVVGTPFDGGIPVYDATLGYCVWQASASVGAAGPMLIRDEVTSALGPLYDAAGDPIYAFPE